MLGNYESEWFQGQGVDDDGGDGDASSGGGGVSRPIYYMGETFKLLYLIFAAILLLNLLIAMMSETFARIGDKKEREFLVARTENVLQASRPSPAPSFVVHACLVLRAPSTREAAGEPFLCFLSFLVPACPAASCHVHIGRLNVN